MNLIQHSPLHFSLPASATRWLAAVRHGWQQLWPLLLSSVAALLLALCWIGLQDVHMLGQYAVQESQGFDALAGLVMGSTQ